MSQKLAQHVAAIIDISCVRSYTTHDDIKDMADFAMKYSFICAHVLPSNIQFLKSLLKGNNFVRVGSPVGFPAGGTLTEIKVAEMKRLVELGCDEIDIMMNVGWFRSGMYDEVRRDLEEVIKYSGKISTKVILETSLLDENQIKIGADIIKSVGANFIKTGTGWVNGETTYECIKAIKESVGDSIQLKASGGIRNLDTLITMYQMGVTRFGVGYQPAIDIIQECLDCDEEMTLENYSVVELT